MTDEEKLMYQLLGELSNSGAPIVAKGALVTKLVLIENGYEKLRGTLDIDMIWVGTSLPTMDELVELVNTSLQKIRGDLYIVVKREYTMDGQSAGIRVFNKRNDAFIMALDIDVRPVIGFGTINKSKIYHYDNITFRGVLPNEILADKISVLSGDRIFRRSKDLLDIYALSHCVDIQTTEITDICKKKGQTLGAFDAFYNRRDDLEHAYNKLQGVENKPPFGDVYEHLTKFIHPIAKNCGGNRIWDHKSLTWSD